MQPTSIGINRTATATSPAAIKAMNQAADELSPVAEVDTSALEAEKLACMAQAEAVGSVPPPASVKGVVKAGVSRLKGGHPVILLDKVGERLAFERTGARLYDALILKYRASMESAGGEPLPPARTAPGSDRGDETPLRTLERIRAEELMHFGLLREAVLQLGGDPTAVTPCADVAAVAGSGLMQVLNDPRTTLAQCLNAILTAELTDNAGWELLSSLADAAGESDLAGTFLGALAQEQQHLLIVKQWLAAVVVEDPNPTIL
jgi:hypothetical protein